jgi:hypothetical protein
MWIVHETEQMNRYLQKTGFSINYLNDETNESNIQELQESLNQETYETITADDYRNIDNAVEAGVAVKELIENHQQNKEEEDDEKQEETQKELPRNEFQIAN